MTRSDGARRRATGLARPGVGGIQHLDFRLQGGEEITTRAPGASTGLATSGTAYVEP